MASYLCLLFLGLRSVFVIVGYIVTVVLTAVLCCLRRDPARGPLSFRVQKKREKTTSGTCAPRNKRTVQDNRDGAFKDDTIEIVHDDTSAFPDRAVQAINIEAVQGTRNYPQDPRG